MNKVKIALIATLTILIIAVCGIIGCYIVDNHSQVLSWIKNEKTSASSGVYEPDNRYFPYTKEYVELLDAEAKAKENMRIIVDRTAGGNVSLSNITIGTLISPEEAKNVLTMSSFAENREGYLLKGYSYERNGEIISELKYSFGAVVLHAVYEKLTPVRVNLHIASNKSIETTLYDSFNYTSFNSRANNVLSGYSGASSLKIRNLNYAGLTRDFGIDAEVFSALNYLVEDENCYVAYEEDFSDVFYAEFVNANGNPITYLFNISELDSIIEENKINKTTFVGWAPEDGASEPVEINAEELMKHDKFYPVYSYKVDSKIKVGSRTITVSYEDLAKTGVNEEGTKLTIGTEEFELHNLTFEGFRVSSTDDPVKKIEEGGSTWDTVFKYNTSQTTSVYYTNIYAKTIPGDDTYYLLRTYIYFTNDKTIITKLNDFDFSFNETLAQKSFQGWATSASGGTTTLTTVSQISNRAIYAVFE